jgi:hypothetical protein
MFLKHLINPKPSIIIFFIIFCAVFAVLPIVQFELSNLFYHSYLHPIIILLASIIIPFFLSTGLNNLIYEKNIIRKGNLVIGFVFIFISSPFINTIEAWVAAFFMLFLFNFLLDSYQKDMPLAQYYNASIILSTLTFVYPNIIFLLILFLVSGINYSNLKWRIIFTILLGLITPYIFYFMFLYLSGNLFFIPDFFNLSLISFSDIEKIQLPKKIWLSVLLLITVFSFFELFMWLYKKSIKSRKTFIIIIWYFIITIWTAFFSNIEYFYFSLTPLAIIIGNYFVYTRNRKIAKILFFMLVISSFYYKYMIAYYM